MSLNNFPIIKINFCKFKMMEPSQNHSDSSDFIRNSKEKFRLSLRKKKLESFFNQKRVYREENGQSKEMQEFVKLDWAKVK